MKKKKNTISNIIIFLCIAGIIGCGIYIYPKLFEYYKAEKNFSSLKEKEIDLKALHKKNKDIVGWIKIKGTKINYPVMQTINDPQFYLRRDFNKKYSIAGTPFLDACSVLGESRNYLVYGHNIKAGTMFHDLTKYTKKDFYKKHKYISFDTLREGKAVYEVAAAFRTETYNFPYYHYADIKTSKTYNEYISKIKLWNELPTKIDLKFEKDQLLTLSTCSYHVEGKQGRMVIVAKKLIEKSDRNLNSKWEKQLEQEKIEQEWEEKTSEGANL